MLLPQSCAQSITLRVFAVCPRLSPYIFQLMDENILFFLEVSSLKSAGGGQAEYLAHVQRIYNLYIKPASPREVNISGDIHIATSTAVHAVLNAPRLDVDDDSCDSDTSTLVKVGTDEDSPRTDQESPHAAQDYELSEGEGEEGREQELSLIHI